MELHVRIDRGEDLTGQIYRQLRDAIAEGRLRRGDRLPPTRELAKRLEVSRNTVLLAYDWLASEGLLSGKRGGGSFVESDPLPRERPRPAETRVRSRAVWASIGLPPAPAPVPAYDFGVGMPDVNLFPFDVWRRLVSKQVRLSALTAGPGDPAGHPSLRAAIARSIAVSRGVKAGPEAVLVTNGAQQAFDLIARVFLEPGAVVAVEEPGYRRPHRLFASCGARVTPVGVDASGLNVEALPDSARLVYVTPSHQFPLGMPMTHARRVALLAWAERRNAMIIEDDYDSEFRFGGRPLETLQAIDRSGRVIYVGSFSKSLLPALRLGFLVAHPSLQRALQTASYVGGWYCQWPVQAALAKFIDEGLLARHVRKMRREYSGRHERILTILEEHFGDWLSPVPSVTGLHLATRFHRRDLKFEREAAERARQSGVGIERLSSYYAGAAKQAGIVLGYGSITTERIDEGLRRLRAALIAATRRR